MKLIRTFRTMTSERFLVQKKEGEDSAAVHDEVMQVVRSRFRPEFLNRIDEIILFHRLRREDMGAIVDIQIKRLLTLLEDRKIKVTLDSKARQWLADKGYDPAYGARPLKRVIQKNVQNPMAEMILAGNIHDGDDIRLSVDKGALTIGGAHVSSSEEQASPTKGATVVNFPKGA